MRAAVAVAVIALALLAGCVEQPPPAGFPPQNACGAEALQGLVGQSARVLETMRFSQDVRVLQPGTAVTMDFSPTRLNIEIDAAERIVRVFCG
jgi:hypothetical protein